jgi:cytochrome P450
MMSTAKPLKSSYTSDIDLFSDDVLLNPYPYFKGLRDQAPVTYLEKLDAYWIGRYDLLRPALLDWETFSSEGGTGFNPYFNEAFKGGLIMLDPPQHTEFRKLYTNRLGYKHIQNISSVIEHRTQEMIDVLLTKKTFEGVSEVAQVLPISVVFDLLGFPEWSRDKVLGMAAGSFDAIGPEGPRMLKALHNLQELVEFIGKVYDDNELVPGSFAADIAEAGRSGQITRTHVVSMLAGYIVAGFDTTINAIANGLWLYAEHGEQWTKLRNNPSLAENAFAEILRIEAPIQYLGRRTTRDVEYEGIVIPKGAHVVMSLASAGRDERHFENPDQFNIERENAKEHISFNIGRHNCAGAALATMEGISIFGELAKVVKQFTFTGPIKREPNSLTRGPSVLPLTIE